MLSFRFLIYDTTRILVFALCFSVWSRFLFLSFVRRVNRSAVLASLNVDPAFLTHTLILSPGLRKRTPSLFLIICSPSLERCLGECVFNKPIFPITAGKTR